MFGSGMNAKHPGRMTLHYLTGVGLAMLSVGAASAQPHPDLSGYWELHNDSFNAPPGFRYARHAGGRSGADPPRYLSGPLVRPHWDVGDHGRSSAY